MKRLWHFATFLMIAPISHSTIYEELSVLEKSIVDKGLLLYKLTPKTNIENTRIGTIYVLTDPPFSKESGVFTLLNHLHVNTKDNVVLNNIFVKPGDVFDEALIKESERSLKSLSLVRSVAVIVPVKSQKNHSQETDLLIATKDLLSLRPTFNFKGSGGSSNFYFTNLLIALGEHNLFGYNKAIDAIYEMQQSAHIASLRYFDPNLFGSPWQLIIRPSVLWKRDSLGFDGFLGDFSLEKPLLSQRDRFGYGLDASYGTRSIIDFNGSKIREVAVPTTNGVENLEKKYRWRYGKLSLYGRVSFGKVHKKELFFGYGLNAKRPSILEESHFTALQEDYFKQHVLPRNELESFINVGFSYFQNRFLTVYDYDNYRVQETIRLGPTITVANDFAAKPILMSDHNFLRPSAKLSLTQAMGKDAFFNIFASSNNRFDGSFTDNLFKYGLGIVSPKIFDVGRIILEARLSTIFDSRDNQEFTLGSDSGIRGVESRFYSGSKGFRTNLEIRSAPLDIWIFHAGLALFYDVGAAFNEWEKANATHALGIGLRIFAPQVSSTLFRLDLAFPIYGIGKQHHTVLPSFGTGQAF